MEPLAYEKSRLSTGPINYGNTPAVPPSITRNVLVNGPPAPTNPTERQFAQSADASSLKGTGPAPSPAAEALSRNAGNVTSGPVSSMAKGPYQFGPALTNTADPANLAKMTPPPMVDPLNLPARVQASLAAPGRISEAYNDAGGGAYGVGRAASALVGEVANPLAAAAGGMVDQAGNAISGVGSFVRGAMGMQPSAPAVVSPAAMPPGGATNASGLGMGAELDGRLGIDKQVPAAVAAAAQPQGMPVPGAPGVTRTGNSYSNVPAVVAGQPAAAPSAGNVIQTAAGGGYSGTPGFTASGGRAAGPVALSAALSAAAARGDTDALVRHYGSFNGETEAGNRAAALTRQAMTLPPGSRQRAGIMSEVAAIHAGESGKAAGALAARKQRGEEAKIAGEVGKMSAEARKATAEANMEQQRQAWTQQMAELNDQTDPDQSKRLALLDAIIASTGKSPDAKYIAIQEETGDKDLTGKSIMKSVGMNARTGKIISAPKPKAFGEMDIKEGMKKWGLDRAGTISHLKTFGQVNVAK